MTNMTDTFSKIEIMLLRKGRRRFIENVVLILLLAALAWIVYSRLH